MDRWDDYAGYDELYHADYYGMYDYYPEDELYHYGVKGQKWGVRRYQNADGSLTDAGRAHYGRSSDRRAGYYNNQRDRRYAADGDPASFRSKSEADKYYSKTEKAQRFKSGAKKALAIGAGAAGAAALGYGAYRLAKSGKFRNIAGYLTTKARSGAGRLATSNAPRLTANSTALAVRGNNSLSASARKFANKARSGYDPSAMHFGQKARFTGRGWYKGQTRDTIRNAYNRFRDNAPGAISKGAKSAKEGAIRFVNNHPVAASIGAAYVGTRAGQRLGSRAGVKLGQAYRDAKYGKNSEQSREYREWGKKYIYANDHPYKSVYDEIKKNRRRR